jgi:peptidoglycan hydrolase-like protein with peptidoglycan-binding domain
VRRERSGRRRTSLLAGVLTATLGVAGGAAAVAGLGWGGGDPAAARSDPAAVTTVPVTRADLVDEVTMDGTLGYGAVTPLTCRAPGTVTWLPAAGTTVARGQALLRVDDQPVVLLYGALPLYRQLAEPIAGPDVAQLKANLRALGYTGFAADQVYSAATATAVRHWQHHLGLPETGVVGIGQVLYAPGPVRIAGQLVRVGADAAADVLSATGTTRQVTAQVDSGRAGWATPGAPVTVVLPDGTTTAGTVATVTTPTAAGGDSGGADQQGAAGQVTATVAVPDQRALSRLEGGDVRVRYAAQTRRNVLSVPVGALLALAEGGYGLRVAEHGTHRVVAVRTGLFADGRVEVSGPELRAGMAVEMPR